MTANSLIQSIPKNYRLPVAIGTVLIGVFLILGVAQVYRTSTPEYAIQKVEMAYERGDLHLARGYITPTGMKVLQVALQGNDDAPQSKDSIVFKKRVGNEFHIRSTMPGEKGPTTADTILVRNGMKWQFHDIYFLTVDGYKVELRASYMIDHPWKTQAILAWRNPGAMFSAFLEGFLIGLFLGL